MKKAKSLKLLSGITGAAALLSNCAVYAEQNVQISERMEESFAEVANVEGSFSYQQDVLTPPDEVFSLFGTAATAACAKPGFAFGEISREDFYINVSGNIQKSYTVSLKQAAKDNSRSRNMICSCATGTAVINTHVTGVPVSSLISMADLQAGVNTISFKSADGYTSSLPLQYVLDKGAMLVYEIAGAEVPEGTQIWMPDTVAKYFTRQVTDIELTAEEKVPEVEKAADEYRAKVSVLNRFAKSFKVGDAIAFEGYADDCGTAIKAVEFSMDGGKTWTTCATKGMNPQQWVYWSFEYVANAAGHYKLDVRACTEDGTVSPLASSVVFDVE